MSKFSENLKQLRLQSNLTQKALADKLGVTDRSIRDWENENVQAQHDALIKIADFFDISIDELLGRKDYQRHTHYFLRKEGLNIYMHKFGENLKQLRIQFKITQKGLAKELNVHVRSIGHWENENKEAQYNTLIKIADYFDVSLDELLGRKDY